MTNSIVLLGLAVFLLVTHDIDPVTGTGRINIAGEDWAARSHDPITSGTKVLVVAADGIVLEVKRE